MSKRSKDQIICAVIAVLMAVSGLAQAPAGFTTTSFFGTPIVMPLLQTYMANWEQIVENQSILSLVNQGDTTPAALGSEAMAVAQAFCAATSNAPVPDCASSATISAVLSPITQAITAAANTVPAGQWVASSWSPSLCSTIALCLAVSSAAPPPPTPPGPLVVLPCVQVSAVTMCYSGSGVSGVTSTGFTYNGAPEPSNAVIEFNGASYQAHITVGLLGPSIWFSPVEAAQ